MNKKDKVHSNTINIYNERFWSEIRYIHFIIECQLMIYRKWKLFDI